MAEIPSKLDGLVSEVSKQANKHLPQNVHAYIKVNLNIPIRR